MRKIKAISIILSFSIFLNVFQLTAFCETNDEITIEDFHKELCSMIDEYDSSQLASSDNRNVVTNRLVVQIPENFTLNSTYGAVDYVGSYEGIYILQYQTPMKAEAAYTKFLNDNIEYVGYDFYVPLSDINESYSRNDNINSSHLSWNSDVAQVNESFELIREHNVKCQEVVVAILDSGMYAEHDYFKNQETGMVDERIEDSGYAQIDEDKQKSYPSLEDDLKHGTHVAGILYDNTMDNIILRPYRVFALWDMVSWTVIWTAFKIAVSDGADIINMSIAEEFSDDEINMCAPFIESIEEASNNGVIVVAAAGNKQYNADRVIPGCSPSVITVAATDERNLPDISYSAYGTCVDIAAPGTNINSTVPRLWTRWEHSVKYNQIYEPIPQSLYMELKGTSMATPLVSAAAAMIKSIDPDITPAEVKRLIKETAFVPDNWEESCNGKNYGTGIVNFYNIAKAMLDPEYSATPTISVNSDNKFEITAPDGIDAKIFYTLDGTTPSLENHLTYTAPLNLSSKNIDVVKAACYENGKFISEPAVYDMITNSEKTIFYKWLGTLTTDADTSKANWRSYNPNIASVDSEGNIKGVSKGDTKITCTLPTGEKIIWKVNVKYSPLQAFFVMFFFGFLWI